MNISYTAFCGKTPLPILIQMLEPKLDPFLILAEKIALKAAVIFFPKNTVCEARQMYLAPYKLEVFFPDFKYGNQEESLDQHHILINSYIINLDRHTI